MGKKAGRWIIQDDVLTEDGNEIIDDYLMRQAAADGSLYEPGIHTLEEMFAEDEFEEVEDDPRDGVE